MSTLVLQMRHSSGKITNVLQSRVSDGRVHSEDSSQCSGQVWALSTLLHHLLCRESAPAPFLRTVCFFAPGKSGMRLHQRFT